MTDAAAMVRGAVQLERQLRKHAGGSHLPALRAVLALYVVAYDQPVTCGDLALLLARTSGATTRIVDQAEEAGWAERVADGDDRRRSYVQLTEAGRRKAEAVLAALERGR